jgi:hypothetical protein
VILVRSVTVKDNERALVTRHGKLERVLAPAGIVLSTRCGR